MSSLSKRKEKKLLQATLSLENETIKSIFSFAVFASSHILISVHSKCKRSWYVILVVFFYRESFFYVKKTQTVQSFLETLQWDANSLVRTQLSRFMLIRLKELFGNWAFVWHFWSMNLSSK